MKLIDGVFINTCHSFIGYMLIKCYLEGDGEGAHHPYPHYEIDEILLAAITYFYYSTGTMVSQISSTNYDSHLNLTFFRWTSWYQIPMTELDCLSTAPN